MAKHRIHPRPAAWCAQWWIEKKTWQEHTPHFIPVMVGGTRENHGVAPTSTLNEPPKRAVYQAAARLHVRFIKSFRIKDLGQFFGFYFNPN